ncbi:flowering time control protein FCA-like isoform X2 [Papaver somniferum]|uniref:flowering time control protein FCA-like isoform X2 n=1 Tax=Papaver somniferum TaxID=3469 RepID=UPI000E70038E|nr:flowering time control protein FCA-like isoform X2 [Papaver somniferum]
MDRYRGGGESDAYDRRMPPSLSSSEPPNRNPNFRPGFSSARGGGGGGGGRSTNFHSPPHQQPSSSSDYSHGGGGGGRSNNFNSPPPSNRGGRSSNFHSPPPSNHTQGGFGGGDGVSGFGGGVARSSNFHSSSPSNRGGRSSNFHSPPPSNHSQGGGGGGDGVSGFGGARGSNFHSPPPSNHSHAGGGGGSGFSSGGDGFRPMGGAASSFNGGGSHGMPISGQKRGFPFSPKGGSPPENTDGAAFAKLFVGSVPRTSTEEEIRPLFEEHGDVIEVALIKDKRTGQQQGCCFIKYATSEDAERAIRALHNQYTLPGGTGPIQVRYADGERERLVEHKLFVGSMNRHAAEKEIKEIFAPYGRVEDVYIMRDDLKQSRGCGFVKFSHRDMAVAAMNALNGTYLMRGCDQPLTVRFADPKRPRVGDSRGTPSFGGPGFGPRSQATPGFRPASNLGDPMGGRGPPSSWNPISPQNAGPPSDVNAHGFNGQLGARSGVMTVPSATGGPMGGFAGPSNGSHPPLAPLPSSIPQQGYNQSMPQISSGGELVSPLSKPLQSPPDLLPPVQLQSQNTPVSSYSQTSTQQGQLQISNSAIRPSLNQAFPSQHSSGSVGQVPVSQPQVQQSASVAPQLLQLGVSGPTGIQQKQQLHQHPHQSPSQLAQVLSQQTQALQARFQSSQQAFTQLQQKMHMMQQSGQNLAQQPNTQATKLQSPWSGNIPQGQTVSNSLATAAAVPGSSTTAATTPALAPIVGQVALPPCTWTEHMSPEGYKYYYNSVTSESRWEKPEELTLFEQRQQQKLSRPQKPPVQQFQSPAQSQSQPQVLSTQQGPQSQQSQIQPQVLSSQPGPRSQQNQIHPQVISSQQGPQSQQNQIQPQVRHPQQLQQPSLNSPYQGSGFAGQQNAQELGYAQSQVSANSGVDPARFHQGIQAQEWAWKNKPTGS